MLGVSMRLARLPFHNAEQALVAAILAFISWGCWTV